MKRRYPLTEEERKQRRASIDKTLAELDKAFAEDEKDEEFKQLLREADEYEKLSGK